MNSPTCLVVFPYDCHASGGIRNAAVGLVRTLVHAGCPVDVASPRSGNPFERKTAELGGAKVRAFHYYERGCRDMAYHIAPDVDFVFLWWCTGDSARFAEAAKKRGLPYLWYSGGVFQCRSVIKYPFQIAYLNCRKHAEYCRHSRKKPSAFRMKFHQPSENRPSMSAHHPLPRLGISGESTSTKKVSTSL